MRPSTSPLRELVHKRDFYAGGLMVLLGLFIAIKGSSAYRLGTLMHMGPGFLPTALGVLLVLIGIAIAAAAVPQTEDGVPADESLLPEKPEWWAWFCILASPVLFIVFGFYTGMAIGTFACVFIAALGDRDVTFKSASILSLIVTGFGVTLFVRLLQVPLAVFTTFPLEIGAVFCAAAVLAYYVFRPLVGSVVTGVTVAVVLAVVYEAGLFYIPVTSTFIFAGLLSYFAFRQASPQLLTAYAVEIIPPVFAVANILGLLFYLSAANIVGILASGGAQTVAMNVIIAFAAIGALAFAIGLYFPRGVAASTTGVDRTGSGNWSTLAFACALAVLAALCVPDKPYLSFSHTGTLFYLGLVALVLLLIGAMAWGGVFYPPVSKAQPGTTGAAPATSSKLFRRTESAIPFALAGTITVGAVVAITSRLALATKPEGALLLGGVIAAMYALGVLVAPGTRTLATDPESVPNRRLFPGSEGYMPYLLALVMAVLALEVSTALDLFSNFLQRGVQ